MPDKIASTRMILQLARAPENLESLASNGKKKKKKDLYEREERSGRSFIFEIFPPPVI